MKLEDVDINQCPMPYHVANAFKNSDRCDYTSTLVIYCFYGIISGKSFLLFNYVIIQSAFRSQAKASSKEDTNVNVEPDLSIRSSTRTISTSAIRWKKSGTL